MAAVEDATGVIVPSGGGAVQATAEEVTSAVPVVPDEIRIIG